MASEWHDYKELKYYLYELWEKEIWDTLSQDIKRLYWNNLKELLGEANADMEFGGNDETDLYVLQPDDSDNNKKRRKSGKRGATCAHIPLSEPWRTESTTHTHLLRKTLSYSRKQA